MEALRNQRERIGFGAERAVELTNWANARAAELAAAPTVAQGSQTHRATTAMTSLAHPPRPPTRIRPLRLRTRVVSARRVRRSVGAMAADGRILAPEASWNGRGWGHTFAGTSGHGQHNEKMLAARAARDNRSVGQWLDNARVAEALRRARGYIHSPVLVDIPPGVGELITPSGARIQASRAWIVPNPRGVYVTAYPTADTGIVRVVPTLSW